MPKPTRDEINAMRLKAFASNNHADRMDYYKACSGWFQDEDFRELERDAALTALQAERDALQVRAEAAEAALARAYMAGRDDAATVAYRACAETRHVTLGKKAEEAILALPVPADLAKRVGVSHE